MTPEVWVEWQLKRKKEFELERMRDKAAWSRNAILAHTMHIAVHQAASRVISVVQSAFGGDGKVDFDYDLLPSVEDFMPKYGDEDPEDDEFDPYDYLPLDPAKMDMQDWVEMMGDVRQWQHFQTGTGPYRRH